MKSLPCKIQVDRERQCQFMKTIQILLFSSIHSKIHFFMHMLIHMSNLKSTRQIWNHILSSTQHVLVFIIRLVFFLVFFSLTNKTIQVVLASLPIHLYYQIKIMYLFIFGGITWLHLHTRPLDMVKYNAFVIFFFTNFFLK
jgi:hypothetical protein